MNKNGKLVLGITGPSVFSPELQSMAENYYKAIPLYINQNGEEDLDYLVEQIDGLILGGGSDIFPGTYGQPITRGDNLSKFDVRRDNRENYLINKCVENKVPIFAICRGMQLVCIRYGFPIFADISGTEICHAPASSDIKINLENGEFTHYIECVPGANKFFDGRIGVASFHHQAIPHYKNKSDEIFRKTGLEVIATSDTHSDSKKNFEIVEIIENKRHLIVGAQFHPEADWMYGNPASIIMLEKFEAMLPQKA